MSLREITDFVLNMIRDDSIQDSAMPHICSPSCLGPLTFHSRIKGDLITLSEGRRQAERVGDSFRDGLLFSNRPVMANERICLKVKKNAWKWKGAMRVGFTDQRPEFKFLPLPKMAIPNLTNIRGHWACSVKESLCVAGSELVFWVSDWGNVYCKDYNGKTHKLLSGVELDRPLWAMIELYGQTCSVYLQGSTKREWFHTRRSCPAPQAPIKPQLSLKPDPSSLSDNSDDSGINMEISAGNCCVVCMMQEPSITLQCGHQCMCDSCAVQVLEQFGFCPVCRHEIKAPLEHSGSV